MFAYSKALLDYLCEHNRHIREMMALAHAADKHGLAHKPVSTVNEWVGEFIATHPHQAAMFARRGWL